MLREIHAVLQRGLHTAVHVREVVSLSDVRRTAGQMVTDVRQLLRVAYLRPFVYTMLVSFVLLYSSVFVYDEVLPEAFQLLNMKELSKQLDAATIAETDLVLFALVAAVPMVNCARLVFLARISGRNVLERFSLRSLFRREGIELVVLVAVVPFVSTELFTATGVPNMINTLSPLTDTVLGEEITAEVRQWATTVSVLYLYPSIILVYLSHSKLSRLYPFTQFVTVAWSWSYFLLVLTILPVAAVYLVVLDEASWSASDVELMVVFVVATTLTLQFVFFRLGAIVVADERMRQTFAGEVGKATQRTLSEFS